jgi:hypothetical protein
MTSSRLPVNVPAIPPKPPQLTLMGAALRPDKTTDPQISGSLDAITSEQLATLPTDLRAELEARKGEAWTRGITYAPENHWAAELRDGCDGTSVDLPPLPAPLGLKVTEASGGTIKAEVVEYQVTAKNANGETTANAAVKITLSKEGSAKLAWEKVNETAEYKIYGRAAGVLKLLTTIGPFDDDEAAEWIDTGSLSPGSAKPPTSNTTGGSGSYGNLPIVTAIPYLVLVEDYCSTWGSEERDFKGRAERLLENATPKAVELEFATGVISRAKGYPNNYLSKEGLAENLTPGTAPSVDRGFEIMQQALADCGFGGQGMIHLQPQATPNLLYTETVGNLMLDRFKNIVVPGVGYTGTGPCTEEHPEGQAPQAGNVFIYATDLVAVRDEDEPTIFTETFAEATDWGQGGEPNTIRMRAQKFAVAYADFACAFCTEVKLPE